MATGHSARHSGRTSVGRGAICWCASRANVGRLDLHARGAGACVYVDTPPLLPTAAGFFKPSTHAARAAKVTRARAARAEERAQTENIGWVTQAATQHCALVHDGGHCSCSWVCVAVEDTAPRGLTDAEMSNLFVAFTMLRTGTEMVSS